MSKLYIFGDSYTTPNFCVDPQDSWWALCAGLLPVNEIHNHSWPGNNIESIAHTILNTDINRDDFIIVAVPPVGRLTHFAGDAGPVQHYTVYNHGIQQQYTQPELCHTGLLQITTHQSGKDNIDRWDNSWAEATALRELLLLDALLDKVMFCVMSVPFMEKSSWPTIKTLIKKTKKPQFQLYKNTYYSANLHINEPVDYDTYGWFGHHGPVGNRHYFDTTAKPTMQKLGWLV